MTTKDFYQAALTSPFWFPFLTLPLTGFGQPGAVVTTFYLASLWFGGLPYLIFIAVIFLFFRHKNGETLHKASRIFPLVFAVWFYFFSTIFTAVFGDPFTSNLLEMMTMYCVVFGFVYVLLVESAFLLMKRLDIIKDFPLTNP